MEKLRKLALDDGRVNTSLGICTQCGELTNQILITQYQPLKYFSYETICSLRVLGDLICIIHFIVLRANHTDMIQILKAVIITTDGVIVQDYSKVQDSLGVYVVTDIEAERRYITECQTLAGFTVKRVNLTYVTRE